MKTRLFTILVALLTIVMSAEASVDYSIDQAGWCVKVLSYTNKLDAVRAINNFTESNPDHSGVIMNKSMSSLPCVVLKGADLVDAQQLAFLLTLANAEAVVVLPINKKNFGSTYDLVFMNFLGDNYDSDGDGFLLYSEVNSITSLDISGRSMSVVPGLGYFSNLKTIDCTHCHNIYTLDVSKNYELRTIRCSRNYMTNDGGSSYGAQKLVDNLPEIENETGEIYYYDNSQGDEKNDMTEVQVAAASAKHWRVLRYDATANKWEDFIQEDIVIDKTHFPDDNFRSFVLGNLDLDRNQKLSQGEIDAATSIAANNKNIANLTGIAYFTKLKELSVSGNKLTSLDLSGNAALEVLDCSDNKLTSLALTSNVALKSLNCGTCQLTQLDVSKNKMLKELMCHDNKLTSLVITQNTELESLVCNSNKLTKLDITSNRKLVTLSCYDNQLSRLNINNNTKLSSLAICYNKINGRAMYEIVTKLPEDQCEMFVPVAKTLSLGSMTLEDGNVLTKQLASYATARGWSPLFLDMGAEDESSVLTPYAGSTPERVMTYTLNDCVISLASATEAEMDLYYGILNGLFVLGDLMASDNFAPYYNKNGKLLFTLTLVNNTTVKVTLAPGVTAADNIINVLSDDDRIVLYKRGSSSIDYFGVKKIELRFGTGIATGIATTEADDGDHTRYNLSGQRVGNGYRGIVVEKGRKKVMK